MDSPEDRDFEPQGRFEKSIRKLAYVVAVAMSVFHIWALGFTVLDPWHLTTIHILFATTLVFLYVPIRPDSIPWRMLDLACVVLATVTYLYVFYDFRGLLMRAGSFPTTPDLVFGTSATLLTLEATRRMTGIALPTVATTALLYGYFGAYLPGMFGHRGYDLDRIISFTYSLDGIFSSALQVSATYIFLFILFGAFLHTTGASNFFLRLATGAVGGVRGGPAKVAIFASALFGTISGSAVANTAGTGAVTIPMMKKIGYKPHFAAAVEAVASTGGQIMPPIMGAAAFIIADIVGVNYWVVALAALIPALLYFATVVIGVDIEAQKTGLRGLTRAEMPNVWHVLRADGHLLLPIFVLLFSLAVLLVSPIRAALFALATMIVVSMVRKHTRLTGRRLFDGLARGGRGSLEVATACAAAGIVVGILNLTGLGHTIASIIITMSGGYILPALMLSMVCCILLGMGLPTTPAYIVAASVIAPALVGLGIAPMQAHLFIFYFACVAVITPPVALAAYTAAGIANASPMQVSLTSVKLGIAAFIVPYFFVFNAALIGHGTYFQVGVAVTSALIGIFFLASGIHAWFLCAIRWSARLPMIVGSCLLINPGWLTDLSGGGLILLGVVLAIFTRRRLGDAPQPLQVAEEEAERRGTQKSI